MFFGEETTAKKPDMPLLRTVKDTVFLIKQIDPHSGITEYFVRCLARTGKIKTLTVGKKVLIHWQSLMNYLEMRKGA